MASEINPSSRRNAVRIAFEGECGHSWYLDVVQHKGASILQLVPRDNAENHYAELVRETQ